MTSRFQKADGSDFWITNYNIKLIGVLNVDALRLLVQSELDLIGSYIMIQGLIWYSCSEVCLAWRTITSTVSKPLWLIKKKKKNNNKNIKMDKLNYCVRNMMFLNTRNKI